MKKLAFIPLTFVFTVMFIIAAFAGEWKQDGKGWWWDNGDGTYIKNEWAWIDGDGDGIAECYFFDESGYLVTDTVTPDGSEVNADGAWVLNGVVQTKGDDNKGPIASPKELTYEKTISGRVTLIWSFKNNSEKEIRKLKLHINCGDAEGRPVQNSFNESNEIKVTYKKTLAPGDEVEYRDVIGYSSKAESFTIETIDIWYADGTKETIEYGYSTGN